MRDNCDLDKDSHSGKTKVTFQIRSQQNFIDNRKKERNLMFNLNNYDWWCDCLLSGDYVSRNRFLKYISEDLNRHFSKDG